jgi:hypothetical protein
MTQAATLKMPRELLEVKYEQYRDAFSELEEENEVLRLELERALPALNLISEGLSVLATIAIDARPNEFETLCKDYAPFKNLMQTVYGIDKNGLIKHSAIT